MNDFHAICLLACLCCFMGGMFMHEMAKDHFHREAIKHHAAKYNSETAEFEWITNNTQIENRAWSVSKTNLNPLIIQ